MSTSREQRSAIERFLETFFQEQNIKWMLGVGLLILLGSSLMLVTSDWEAYSPLAKSLILLGYTAGVHVAGQVTYQSLGLRKTGTVLMALTVLLIPLGFHALRWIYEGSVGQEITSLGLLGIQTTFSTLAAKRIFRHFLRRSQPTFLASYGVLCVSAVVLDGVSAVAAPWVALILWTVFSVGAVKVNRHVFWLTEEHRLPRICGFFPILLLGGQFLTLFAVGLAQQIPLEWIGLGVVLTTVPVLLTVDSLARVHLEVHGPLSRPLPFSVVIPMLVGLGLTVTGLCLAGVGFPGTVALAPTAALAAILMGVVAHRTNNSKFVWAMLACVLTAYQCSPVFFRDVAQQIVEHGASAVSESRLPIAFYGLTYFPLLIALSLVARFRERTRDGLFATPLRQFAVGLASVLLAVSLTHVKAIFPVGLALCVLFAMKASLFRSSMMAALAVVTWLTATFGLAPFAESVLMIDLPQATTLVAFAVSSTALLFPGKLVDYRLTSWSSTAGPSRYLCELSSLGTAMLTAIVWLVDSLSHLSDISALSGGLLALLIMTHAVRRPNRYLGEFALIFVGLFSGLCAFSFGWSVTSCESLVTVWLTTLWTVGPVLQGRLARAFATASRSVSQVGFLSLLTVALVPNWTASIALGFPFSLWLTSLAATAWAFDSARRENSRWLLVTGWISLLATSAVAAIEVTGSAVDTEWLPALWSNISLVAVMIVWGIERRVAVLRDQVFENLDTDRSNKHLLHWTLGCATVTLALTAGFSLFIFTIPMRIAGGIALGGLLMVAAVKRHPVMRTEVLMLVNWQLVCGAIQLSDPAISNATEFTINSVAVWAIPVALILAVLNLSWQRSLWRYADNLRDIIGLISIQRALLRIGVVASLVAALILMRDQPTALQTTMLAATFAVLCADSITTAFRLSRNGLPPAPEGVLADESFASQSLDVVIAGRVWAAQTSIFAGVLYLVLSGAIPISHGFSLFASLLAGVVFFGISRWASRSDHSTFLAQPLSITGQCLPAMTVAMALFRHATVGNPHWLGMNSLALLLAAGFYFWLGLERKRSELMVGSAIVLNVALALLWNELAWTDPQFFMIPLGVSMLGLVELLRKELPPRCIDPLRYASALVILVSPTFHIVGGSWLHLFSLMVTSVAITLLAMGLRIRALMYTGLGFLIADLIAMVVRGSIDNPSVLWIAGITLGSAVVGLAAYCERHREQLLQRMRLLAAELDTWK